MAATHEISKKVPACSHSNESCVNSKRVLKHSRAKSTSQAKPQKTLAPVSLNSKTACSLSTRQLVAKNVKHWRANTRLPRSNRKSSEPNATCVSSDKTPCASRKSDLTSRSGARRPCWKLKLLRRQGK